MSTLEFLLRVEGCGCATLVKCKRTEQVCCPDDILSRLRRAVTQWINTTPEGQEAWTDSVEDFNIGDFALHDADPDLQRLVKENGLLDFLATPVGTDDAPSSWDHDTVLYGREQS